MKDFIEGMEAAGLKVVIIDDQTVFEVGGLEPEREFAKVLLSRNYNKEVMILCDVAGKPCKKGQVVKSLRGTEYVLVSGRAPHKLSSQGFIYVEGSDGISCEFYPSVCNLKWMYIELDHIS